LITKLTDTVEAKGGGRRGAPGRMELVLRSLTFYDTTFSILFNVAYYIQRFLIFIFASFNP